MKINKVAVKRKIQNIKAKKGAKIFQNVISKALIKCLDQIASNFKFQGRVLTFISSKRECNFCFIEYI